MSQKLSKIEAGNLFNVNGLVAVITGGGSGKYTNLFSLDSLTDLINNRTR